MTNVRTIPTAVPPAPAGPRVSPGRAVVLALVATVVLVVAPAYFLQHFPATMLLAALLLLTAGRLAPLVRELADERFARLVRCCLDGAGTALLALAAFHGAAGEILAALGALRG